MAGMRIVVVAAFVSIARVVSAAPLCGGDCTTNGAVTVDELVTGVNIALGATSVGQCTPMDGNGDHAVTVDELVVAVNNALTGCPSFAGEYYAAVALSDGQTGRLSLRAQPDGSATGTLVIDGGTTSSLAGLLGGAAAGPSVSLSGSFDLDTGAFSITGSIDDGQGHTIPVNVSGNFPGRPGGGTVNFQIGPNGFSSSITRGSAPTPTPTRTPAPGTTHIVKVGQANLPFDPEYLEIPLGDTVVWMWVGGPHSVQSGEGGFPGQTTCTADGRFDSGVQSSGTFSYTFTAVGDYTYHCGVPGHCENFESGIIVIRGTPTPTATRTPTVPPTPTASPTPATIGGVSTAMLGVFAGRFYTQFNTDFALRLEIRVEEDLRVLVTDLEGFLLGLNSPYQMTPLTPTKLQFVRPDPFNMVVFTLELVGPGHITGTYVQSSMGMGGSTVTIDVMK